MVATAVKHWRPVQIHMCSYDSASPSIGNRGHSNHVCSKRSTGNEPQHHRDRRAGLLL